MKPFCEKINNVDKDMVVSDVETNLKDIEKRLLQQQHSNEISFQSVLENMNAVPEYLVTEETVSKHKAHKYIHKKLYCNINFAIKENELKSIERTISMDDNIIVLNDENGNEVEFEFLDLIPYQGQEYVVLLPTDDEADEVVILQLSESGDDSESYIGVEDENIVSAVFDIFKDKYKDEFNFVD